MEPELKPLPHPWLFISRGPDWNLCGASFSPRSARFYSFVKASLFVRRSDTVVSFTLELSPDSGQTHWLPWEPGFYRWLHTFLCCFFCRCSCKDCGIPAVFSKLKGRTTENGLGSKYRTKSCFIVESELNGVGSFSDSNRRCWTSSSRRSDPGVNVEDLILSRVHRWDTSWSGTEPPVINVKVTEPFGPKTTRNRTQPWLSVRSVFFRPLCSSFLTFFHFVAS